MIWLFVAGLIALAWFDFRDQRVHVEPVLFLAVVGFCWQAVRGDAVNALSGMAIGIAFFGLQYLISKGRWIGEGDIYVAAAMGAWLGWLGVLVALYAAYIAGGLIALILLLCGVWKRGQRVPFVPFLALGGIVAVAVGYWG